MCRSESTCRLRNTGKTVDGLAKQRMSCLSGGLVLVESFLGDGRNVCEGLVQFSRWVCSLSNCLASSLLRCLEWRRFHPMMASRASSRKNDKPAAPSRRVRRCMSARACSNCLSFSFRRKAVASSWACSLRLWWWMLSGHSSSSGMRCACSF